MSAESTPSAIDIYRTCVDEINNERPPLRSSRLVSTPRRRIGRGSSQDPEVGKLSRPHPYHASTRRLIDRPRGSQSTVTERPRISYLEGSKGANVSGGNFVAADGDFIGEIVYNAGVTINNYSSSVAPSAAPHAEEAEVTIGGDPETPLRIQRTCDVYNRHLACKGRGFPLWIPEPNNNLSMEYRRRGIDIGDVGVITKMGNFDFLFNICLPDDHPINRDGVPAGFSPCKPTRSGDIQRYTEFEAGAFLTSTSIDHSRFDGEYRYNTLIFESSAMEGAILTMPDGAETLDLGNVLQFERYMAKNVASWYRYVLVERGRHVENGDVRLVVGRDNSRTWGMATFEKATTSGDALQLKFGPLDDNTLGTRRYAWELSGAASARTGPSRTQIEELSVDGSADVANQTLFVRTLNARLKSKTWEKLTTAISEELTQLYEDQECYDNSSDNIMSSPPSSEGTSSSTTSASGNPGAARETMIRYKGIANIDSNPGAEQIAHPANIINELALQKTSEESDEFEMIITSDKDWMSVLTEHDPALPSGKELFDRIMKHRTIQFDIEDGIYVPLSRLLSHY
ncbi:hypothetical protein JR316_0010990 [Psilocybe cubensis]|uniref:Uncharacterized protein n=1 Tax=Psilocybe cubensis TaxID=181762 RepID=A0ACB8GNN6_PSICU|nr:hypothetical protein JR316_0010990 [Psilocybe cubensis]KAH9477074.1 hypothetical protein JR316_0010990 [Psilocybe cubensis]